jgi:hypothetical protein
MSGFGQNVGYVDELNRRFLANPGSVGEAASRGEAARP